MCVNYSVHQYMCVTPVSVLVYVSKASDTVWLGSFLCDQTEVMPTNLK